MPIVVDSKDLVNILLCNVHFWPEDVSVVAPECLVVSCDLLLHFSRFLCLPVRFSLILDDELTSFEDLGLALDNDVEKITLFALTEQGRASININQLNST